MTNVNIKAEKDGPLLIKVNGKTTVTLCRCGRSKTQPSCDGTHEETKFEADPSEIQINE